MTFLVPYAVGFALVLGACIARHLGKSSSILSPDDFNFGMTASLAGLLLVLDAKLTGQTSLAARTGGVYLAGVALVLSLFFTLAMARKLDAFVKANSTSDKRHGFGYWGPWFASNLAGSFCVVLTVWLKLP
ncbi:hypothetical protein [Polaromonas naphthalenivorans]|uniref:hypothetical protein n=1 Tax=Polaromonas naphthalenivorans TaxID=216465 RepID=UPI0012ECDA26|nr:hypothetical protein [Polaromonas naphthalenivorans]